MKKRGGKGTTAGQRRAKDLSPRRTRGVRGGELQSNVLKKLSDTDKGIRQKIG